MASTLTGAWVSNTKPRDKSVAPEAVEVGIDTIGFARYYDSERDLALVKAFCGPSGIASERAGDHRLVMYPGPRMLGTEGHAEVDGLGNPAAMVETQRRVLEGMRDLGLPLGSDGGVRRIDSTVTLRFPDPSGGLTFLTGLSLLDVPRVKVRAVPVRQPETVEFLAPRTGKKLARTYDKGVERAARGDFARAEPAGSLVRMEAQNRFRKDARMRAEVLADNPDITEGLFRGRFAPVAVSSEGLTAATIPILREHVVEMVQAGAIKGTVAERLVGFLMTGGLGLTLRTRQRRIRELRDHGLVLLDPMRDPVSVDLGASLDEALGAWSRA